MLTRKTAPPLDVAQLDLPPLKQLSVSGLGSILHLEFVGAESYGAETLTEFREDLQQLTQNLPLSSKVLLDFERVKNFCADSIQSIVDFDKRLRYKGNRVVLCCINSEVLESFFPPRTSEKR